MEASFSPNTDRLVAHIIRLGAYRSPDSAMFVSTKTTATMTQLVTLSLAHAGGVITHPTIKQHFFNVYMTNL